jgi:hypothetical protein
MQNEPENHNKTNDITKNTNPRNSKKQPTAAPNPPDSKPFSAPPSQAPARIPSTATPVLHYQAPLNQARQNMKKPQTQP